MVTLKKLFYEDYSNLIEYKESKGYFCLKDKTEGTLGVCLGGGKGRKYPEMKQESMQFLADYYNDFNQDRLAKTVTLRLVCKLMLPRWHQMNEEQAQANRRASSNHQFEKSSG